MIVGEKNGEPLMTVTPLRVVPRWLEEQLEPRGVGVVVEAEHTCMTLRRVQARRTTTVTSTLRGVLRDDPRSRQEFFALTRTEGRHG